MISLKVFLVLAAERLLRALWLFPLRKNQVLFISYGGKQFSDNPKALYLKYLEHQDGKRLVWAADSPKTEEAMRILGLETVRVGTFRYLRTFCQSGTVITNCHVFTYLPVRRNQVIINTWHGMGPMKKVGFDDPASTAYDRAFFRIQNRKYAAFLSGCTFTTDVMYRRSFDYHGTVLEWGLPRNAMLFQDPKEVRMKVMQALHIPPDADPYLLLYAPTYRGHSPDAPFLPEEQRLDPGTLSKALEKANGRPCVCLFRGHHMMLKTKTAAGCVDAGAYPDIQDLLCAADALITDFSSCMTDMAVARKPIVLYVPDAETYLRERGMYWPLERLPFPLCRTQDQVVSAFADMDAADYARRLDAYLDAIGLAEGPDSAELVYRYLEKGGPFPPDAVIGRRRRIGV